jgi:poly(3-hydroxybutyrate) depolymerase
MKRMLCVAAALIAALALINFSQGCGGGGTGIWTGGGTGTGTGTSTGTGTGYATGGVSATGTISGGYGTGAATTDYFYYIPNSATGISAPLVLYLHGSGEWSQIQSRFETCFKSLSEQKRFVWASIKGTYNDGEGYYVNSPTDYILKNMVTKMQGLTSIDSSKVYLFGYSAGANATLSLITHTSTKPSNIAGWLKASAMWCVGPDPYATYSDGTPKRPAYFSCNSGDAGNFQSTQDWSTLLASKGHTTTFVDNDSGTGHNFRPQDAEDAYNWVSSH